MDALEQDRRDRWEEACEEALRSVFTAINGGGSIMQASIAIGELCNIGKERYMNPNQGNLEL